MTDIAFLAVPHTHTPGHVSRHVGFETPQSSASPCLLSSDFSKKAVDVVWRRKTEERKGWVLRLFAEGKTLMERS
jgi:hypothetical protein